MLIKGFTHYDFKGKRLSEKRQLVTHSGLYDIAYTSCLWKSVEIGFFFFLPVMYLKRAVEYLMDF